MLHNIYSVSDRLQSGYMRKYFQRGDLLQTIYVDSLICINIFIDYLILKSTHRVLHIITSEKRIVIGAVAGGFSVLIVFLPDYNIIFSFIIRIISSAIIILISFGYHNFQKFIVRTITYYGISMILFAAVITIELVIDPVGVMIYNDIIYFDISPVVLVVTTIFTYLLLYIYKRIKEKHRIAHAIRTVTIYTDNEKKITFESAVDTGCNLKEPFSGLSVIIVENELLLNEAIPENKMRIIPLNTLTDSDYIMGFKPEKVCIDNIEINKGCYIGITHNKLKGEIKSIISAELSEAVS